MRGRVFLLCKCLHIDVGEDDVVQDVDSVNLVELSDAVSELEHRDVVHRHPERLRTAQDLHLEEEAGHSVMCYVHQDWELQTVTMIYIL